jgi:hypothetical protein
VSAWSAYLLSQPLYIAMFYASGVFCFGIVGLSKWSVWDRENTIYGKLKASSFSAFIAKISDDLVANCACEIENKSLFDIYYQLEEADLALAGKTNISGIVDNAIMIVQSTSSNSISFATIRGLKPEAMSGRMKLKLKYGKKKEHLNHRFEIIAEPQISVGLNEEGDVVATRATLRLIDVKYL